MIDFNYTLLIQFLNLLVVLILLNFFLFKPVLRALDKREKRITGSSADAQSIFDDVKRMERAYEDGSRDRKRPITESRDATVSAAHSASLKMIEQARADLADELSRIRGEIASEGDKTLAALKKDLEKLSNEVAQKILKRSLT
jgi:F-type H+-transporting ATPase subunit b